MGVPYQDVPMTEHYLQITVRNQKGVQMLELIKPKASIQKVEMAGDCRNFVMQTVLQEEKAQNSKLPKFIGKLLAKALTNFGPQGLEFAKYSIDYHTIRNYLFVKRKWGAKADQHIPGYSKQIVKEYDQKGQISRLLR